METPKAKAIELYEKYKIFASGLIPKMWNENTKAIALMNVNEILELDVRWEPLQLHLDYPKSIHHNQTKEFWMEVKKELENLKN